MGPPDHKSSAGEHFPILDFIRFGAALLVVFGHARSVLLVGIDSVAQPNTMVRGFYLVTGLHEEGVVLFFVVSGFLVGGLAWQRMAAGSFDGWSYFLSRFTRIYLVLLPSLLLVAILSNLGAALFAEARLYAERPLFPSGVRNGWSWGQIPCHLLSVQAVLCDAWGANPPLWSLGLEWTFYLIGPLFFAIALQPMSIAKRVLLAAAMVGLVVYLQHQNAAFIQWFAFWLLGVFSAVAEKRWRIFLFVGLAGIAICLAALVLSRTRLLPQGTTHALVAIGLAAGLACNKVTRWRCEIRLIDRGARFSYSLYLIHLPVILFAGAAFQSLLAWPNALVQPDLRGISGFCTLVLVALLAAWAFAAITEDHTDRVRRFLGGRLGAKPAGQPSGLSSSDHPASLPTDQKS